MLPAAAPSATVRSDALRAWSAALLLRRGALLPGRPAEGRGLGGADAPCTRPTCRAARSLAPGRRPATPTWSLRGPRGPHAAPTCARGTPRYLLSPDVQRPRATGVTSTSRSTRGPRRDSWHLEAWTSSSVTTSSSTSTAPPSRPWRAASTDPSRMGATSSPAPSDPPLGRPGPARGRATDGGVLYRGPWHHRAAPVPSSRWPPCASALTGGTALAPWASSRGPGPSGADRRRARWPRLGWDAPGSAPPRARSPLTARSRGGTSGRGAAAARRPGTAETGGRRSRRLGASTSKPRGRAIGSPARPGQPRPRGRLNACAQAAARHPLAVELRYLEALLLLGLGRVPTPSARHGRRSTWSPRWPWPTSPGPRAAAPGRLAGALRAFRTAEALCAALPPETLVPLAEGERAGPLAEVARKERGGWRPLSRRRTADDGPQAGQGLDWEEATRGWTGWPRPPRAPSSLTPEEAHASLDARARDLARPVDSRGCRAPAGGGALPRRRPAVRAGVPLRPRGAARAGAHPLPGAPPRSAASPCCAARCCPWWSWRPFRPPGSGTGPGVLVIGAGPAGAGPVAPRRWRR